MSCVSHPNRETYSSCNNCGRPVCRECSNYSYSYYREVLCLDCFRQRLTGYTNYLRKTKNKRLFSIITITICYILVIVCFILFREVQNNPQAIENPENFIPYFSNHEINRKFWLLILSLLFCGISVGFTWAKFAFLGKMVRTSVFGPDLKVSVDSNGSGTVTSTGYGGVIFFFFAGCLIGGIFAPLIIIINIFKFFKVLKEYKYHRSVLKESYNL